jgi:hypothetical protein
MHHSGSTLPACCNQRGAKDAAWHRHDDRSSSRTRRQVAVSTSTAATLARRAAARCPPLGCGAVVRARSATDSPSRLGSLPRTLGKSKVPFATNFATLPVLTRGSPRHQLIGLVGGGIVGLGAPPCGAARGRGRLPLRRWPRARLSRHAHAAQGLPPGAWRCPRPPTTGSTSRSAIRCSS